MVGSADKPMPWLAPLLRQTLQTQRAHALLLHGPPGVGQFELAVTIAQAWLCESVDRATLPCGICASCRLVQARSHPDLLVLVPEALQEALGWGGAADDAGPERASKAKPSKEIKVEAVRAAVAFAQTTSARGRGKVVVVHPAERMNAVSANAMLKTLEEPPGDARFLLASAAADALLPTIRSRCQRIALQPPPSGQAIEWLAGQGVDDPAVLLAATGGQPQEVLAWIAQGIDAASWKRLPRSVGRGDASPFAGWPLPRLVDALQKLCHDAACVAAGAAPRYFPVESFAGEANSVELGRWMRELTRVARHAQHPWNAGLLTQSLVQQGRRALGGEGRDAPTTRRGISVHSPP